MGRDTRECGWLGCGDLRCEPVCAAVNADVAPSRRKMTVPGWDRKCEQIATDFNLIVLHGLGPITGVHVDQVFRKRLRFVPKSVTGQPKPQVKPVTGRARETGCVDRTVHVLGSPGLGHELAVLWVALARVLWWRER